MQRAIGCKSWQIIQACRHCVLLFAYASHAQVLSPADSRAKSRVQLTLHTMVAVCIDLTDHI